MKPMKDKNWHDEYLQMIRDCNNRKSKMSEWESNFMDSLFDWICDDKIPTPKQIEKLENIWERVTKNG